MSRARPTNRQNASIDLSDRNANHVVRLIRNLSDAGWEPERFPAEARIIPNRQFLELRTPHRSIRIRASIYKVGDRGEPHRLDERRIEITTTFASGLPRLRNRADVVLGYDFAKDAYIGLDPRRLGLGGNTHNASSSVDPAALMAASASRILVRPHETPSLGLEYQAVFRPSRLAEYLFNYQSIHRGLYLGDGLFSGSQRRRRQNAASWTLPVSCCRGNQLILTHNSTGIPRRERTVRSPLVEAYEIDRFDALADMSPEEFEAIRRKCREVGDRGEHFVYRYERKRLNRAGRGDLAGRIDWVSRKAVGKGYDIKSFEIDGSPRHIEVKATIATGNTFFISSNEWNTAQRLRTSYWIYRVVNALDAPEIVAQLQDPTSAEERNLISRVPDGWRVTLL